MNLLTWLMTSLMSNLFRSDFRMRCRHGAFAR